MERNTRQRSAIRDAIAPADCPLLPQEMLESAQHQVPGPGIATVHCNVKALVEEGALQAVNLPGEKLRFEELGHQHHLFQGRLCQRVSDVHACPGDLGRLVQQGFTVEDHDLTPYGRCKACVAPADKAASRKVSDSGIDNATHMHRHRG